MMPRTVVLALTLTLTPLTTAAILLAGAAPAEAAAKKTKPAKKAKAAKKVKAAKAPEKKGPKHILGNELVEPNEIDFDSVPPPSGMPRKYASDQAPAKKQLDRSLRPSAPFDEEAEKKAAQAKAEVKDDAPDGDAPAAKKSAKGDRSAASKLAAAMNKKGAKSKTTSTDGTPKAKRAVFTGQ
ncbi:hypothetical protein L6R52_09465 [Myxococcota bacterium]|nr:hypothetical protein [Myxococcota bacterium]